ncbi:hypothetical protein [Roseivirga sp.]|uniref:hypothetical protein n=1 Tax=Roseivirga sp. TaxID=1964215 RepID=UPI003B8CBDF0
MKKSFLILSFTTCTLLSCGSSDDTSGPADTTPPELTIANILAGDGIVDDAEANAFVISGTSNAENDQTVSLSLSDNLNNLTASASVMNGQWSTLGIDIQSLSDGPITISANVSDKAGNRAETAESEVLLDQNDLQINITTPIALDDLIVSAESKVLKVYGTTDAANGQTVRLFFSDGENRFSQTTTVNNGTWVSPQTNLVNLNDGDISISARVEDTNGEAAQVRVSEIPLDKSITPPAPSQEGTIFLSSTIMTQEDASTLMTVTANGIGTRTMYDRRTASFNQEEARLFNATYSDGFTIEIQVNPEFTATEALQEAEKYGREVGRLPKVLKRDAETMWIHKGEELFGGGNNNFLIHTGTTATVYEPRGILLETLVHEGSHTSLDAYIKDDPDWQYAQTADGTFISEYARDNPDREDIAETFLLYIAYKYRPETLTETLRTFIKEAVSYRMDYFDKQNFELAPFH